MMKTAVSIAQARLLRRRLMAAFPSEMRILSTLSRNETVSPRLAPRSLSTRPLTQQESHWEEYEDDDVQKEFSSTSLPSPVDPGKKFRLNSSSSSTVPLDDFSEPEQNIVTELTYTGGHSMPVTTHLHIVTPEEDTPRGTWPVFRLMNEDGKFRDPALDDETVKQQQGRHGQTETRSKRSTTTTTSNDKTRHDLEALRSRLINLYPYHKREIESNALFFPSQGGIRDETSLYEYDSSNTLMRAHRLLVRLREMDTILQNAQRQGRISFYMTCRGEEAIHMGAGSALQLDDALFTQYREQGLLMWRGFTLEQFTNQCFSNNADLGKGRQMPVHYGSRALNYHTVSSPLGTQLPQAVGAAYRLKLAGKPNVSVCFFGDGCASTTDFHSALNFASTLDAPVVFVCRNNGYAISTPITDQYRGDGIVSRAPGYGMAGIRVDGNDMFAVHAAMRECKAYALEHQAPVLMECMTYRMGHHSTSDDSTRYRCGKTVENFEAKYDPIARVEHFFLDQNLLTAEEAVHVRDEEKLSVLRAMEQAERRPKPPLESLFEDVYQDMPLHLQEQQAALQEHLRKYPNRY